jgi:hypothetical protein
MEFRFRPIWSSQSSSQIRLWSSMEIAKHHVILVDSTQSDSFHTPVTRGCAKQYFLRTSGILHIIRSNEIFENILNIIYLSCSSNTMNFCIALSLLVTGAAAFAPAQVTKTSTALNAGLNGWVPDESKFAWGLPGSIAPIADFDPAGFAADADLDTMKNYREAETQHGRVAMLAVLGLLVTEEPIELHPLFEAANKDIGPAIRHLDDVRAVSPFFFEILALVIGTIETSRALTGWENPNEVLGLKRTLKASYYPGDIGFDPLTLKPADADEFAELSTKELQNGRLAMLGAAGMVAQELVNGKEIFVNLGLAVDRFDPASVPVHF